MDIQPLIQDSEAHPTTIGLVYIPTASSAITSFITFSNMTETKEQYLTYKIGYAIDMYYLPVVIVLGFLGNTCSLLVTLQSQNRGISCCVYMTAVAIVDNMMLCIGVMHWIITVFSSESQADRHKCQISTLIFQSLACYGVCLIVLMTLDRCLAVKLPLEVKVWRTPTGAVITVFVSLVFVIGINLPYYFLAGYDDKRQCVALADDNDYSTLVYAWCYFIIVSFLPCVGILIMNTIIICTLKRRRQFLNQRRSKAREMNEVTSGSKYQDSEGEEKKSERISTCLMHRRSARERQMTFVLLLVSFAVLLLTEPQYIRRIVYLILDQEAVSTPRSQASFILVHAITQKLFYTNNALNFYLYILGSKKFRTDFLNVFRCKRH